MNQEISEIIKFYLSNYDFVNEKFIMEIYNLILKNEDLSDFLIGLESKKKFSFWGKTIANYGYFSKKIFYAFNRLIYHAKKYHSINFSNIKLSNLYLYSCILHTLFHEIEHVRQFKIISKDINQEFTPEEFILYHELFFICEFKKKIGIPNNNSKDYSNYYAELLYFMLIKRKFYTFSPSERLADIKAEGQVYEISQYFSNSDFHLMTEYNFYNALIRGYSIDDLSSPTEYFFDKMNKQKECLEIIEKTNGLEELEKMKLGLEVSSDFLEATKQKRDSIIKNLRK